jgi:hypothetical protein
MQGVVVEPKMRLYSRESSVDWVCESDLGTAKEYYSVQCGSNVALLAPTDRESKGREVVDHATVTGLLQAQLDATANTDLGHLARLRAGIVRVWLTRKAFRAVHPSIHTHTTSGHGQREKESRGGDGKSMCAVTHIVIDQTGGNSASPAMQLSVSVCGGTLSPCSLVLLDHSLFASEQVTPVSKVQCAVTLALEDVLAQCSSSSYQLQILGGPASDADSSSRTDDAGTVNNSLATSKEFSAEPDWSNGDAGCNAAARDEWGSPVAFILSLYREFGTISAMLGQCQGTSAGLTRLVHLQGSQQDTIASRGIFAKKCILPAVLCVRAGLAKTAGFLPASEGPYFVTVKGLADRAHVLACVLERGDKLLLYNELCLRALDVVLGALLCYLLVYVYAGQLEAVVALVPRISVRHDDLRELVQWMMHNPGGLKLNLTLSTRCGELVLSWFEYWDAVCGMLLAWARPHLLLVLRYAGLLGLSTWLSVALDVVQLQMWHSKVAHTLFGLAYRVLSTFLSSMWKLFRGKKKNVLRARVDNCKYSTTELALGTLLFVVSFFLFPTIFIYYLLFVCVRLAMGAASLSVMLVLNTLSWFPLHLVIKRILHPHAFIQAVTVSPAFLRTATDTCVASVHMQGVPMSVGAICRHALATKILRNSVRTAFGMR